MSTTRSFVLCSQSGSQILLSCFAHRYEATEEGYDAKEKRDELFHRDSRFLVLYPSPAADRAADPATPLGYCIFRFDTEETASEDEDELCDVAYWCVSIRCH